jgi:ATP-dependent helicase/nuclease subunit B
MSSLVSTQFDLPFGAAAPSGGKRPPSSRTERPRLLESLAAVCREFPLDEKVLIAPGRFVGHQIVESLVRSGTPWIHLRVESVRSLAHAVAGPMIAEEGLTLLSRAQALALIEQACAEMLTPGSYFGELAGRPGLHRAIQSTFDELRSAGISPSSLPESAFGDARKVVELKEVLAAYESALARGKFVDRAEVLRRAVVTLRKSPAASDADDLYVLAGKFELSAAETELVNRVSGGRLRTLELDEPESWTVNASQARLFRALGEENEIREILRRVLGAGIPFDDVEILATDPETYGPLVYELVSEHDIPCTFGRGIPSTFTRPGQAALGYLRWLGRNFESEELRQVVAGGLLDLSRTGADPPGPIPAARELREARIGWGRERSLASLDSHIARRTAEVESARRRSDENEEDLAARIEWLKERLATARAVRDLVARLLGLAPEPAAGKVELRAVARSASAFVEGFARIAGDLDAMASSALRGLFGELETLPVTRLPVEEAVTRLSDAVRSLHVGADRPRPGKLYVGDYRSGGYSGRSRIFLVGVDSRRHPGSGLQDPVLLDDERRGINAAVRPRELAMHGSRPAENALALKSCVARVRGEMTVTYACWDLLQAREQFPAASFLEIFRLASGLPSADYSEVDRRLGAGVGFLTEAPAALDETEWWLSRTENLSLAGGRGAPAVRAAYPWLEDGFRAESARDSDALTVWDGWIRDPAGLDPRRSDKPTSCSRLQDLARCPYSYFLKRVLRIQPPEDVRADPTIWLTAMEKGTLLHEVFRRFYADPVGAVVRPQFGRDRARIDTIAREEIAKWRANIPPRSEAAFDALSEEVLDSCRIFLLAEDDHCRKVAPKWFEVGFGPSREATKPPGGPQAVRIPLGKGERFLLSGRIDRVDEESPDAYQVWDYKTGSSWDTADPERGRGGRRLQDALYAQALEGLLERAGRPGRVTRSGYFYPGRRGEGERFDAPLDVGAARETLTALFDLLAGGAFPHAPTKEDCSICEFGKVCGGVERAVARAQGKLENISGNPMLEPYRRLNPS